MKHVLLLIALLPEFFALTGCTGDRQVAARPSETVRGLTVLEVQEQTVADAFPAVGTVRADRSAAISAEIMGRITAINVREGDSVRQGQILAVLEDVQPKAGVEQAEAALKTADHEVAAAESEQALAQSTLERMNKLYREKSISPHEFDESNARLQTASAHRDAAIAARAQAAAGVQQSRITLDRSRVRAPFDGMISDRRVDPGTLATPGLQLFTLEAAGHYRLEATVNESDLKYVRLGESVPVVLDALASAPMTGKIIEIIPAADPASRSFTVKVELPANKNLRSGLFGHANFSRGPRPAIFIPAAAVVERGQVQSVYAVDEKNIAAVRYVTLGREQEGQVEILSGLSAGDRLVSDPGGRELAGKRIEAQ